MATNRAESLDFLSARRMSRRVEAFFKEVGKVVNSNGIEDFFPEEVQFFGLSGD